MDFSAFHKIQNLPNNAPIRQINAPIIYFFTLYLHCYEKIISTINPFVRDVVANGTERTV